MNKEDFEKIAAPLTAFLNQSLKELSTKLKSMKKDLTAEELNSINRFEKRAKDCIKNNDIAGLNSLFENFKKSFNE